jgi:hypothetical protein
MSPSGIEPATFRLVMQYLNQLRVKTKVLVLVCSVNRLSHYNLVNKNQLDAKLILSTFRQPVHFSGVSRPIIRRYNAIYTTFGIYCTF